MSTAPEPGCYVDGHWGQYATARVVEVATELGWQDDTASSLARRHLASMGPSTEPGLSDGSFEHLVEKADEAERWLNEHRAPEGHSWHWSDGEFGLYADDPEDC